jgi:long-chain acyl-CoA synthetase
MATDTRAEGTAPAQTAADTEGIHRATLVQNFLRQVTERAAKPALYFRTGDRYAAIPWNEFGKAARRWAAYLISEGVAAHEHVGIWSANRPEWHIADIGVLMIRARPVPVYFTFSAEQGGYVLGHSESKVVVVENGVLRDRVLEVRDQLPALRRIVVIDGQDSESTDGFVIPWQAALTKGQGVLDVDGDEVDRRAAAVELDDVATLIYTSGTTGPPKAVLLTHGNVAAAIWALEEFVVTTPDDRVVSHLPLAHIAERFSTEFRSYAYGNPVYFVDGIANLGERLREVRPNLFFSVPRIWEKMAIRIQKGVDELPASRRGLARWSLKIGSRVAAVQERGASVGPWLTARHRVADRLVLRKLRALLGFDDAHVLATGAAPVSADTLRFFKSIGLEVLEEYGQSEDTGVTSMNRPGSSRIGSVGKPFRGNEVRLAEDGEILVRGGAVFVGYYKDPAATAETLIDGWLHTGDVGEFDADGNLRITDRKKDLIITAGGKNISPSNIEQSLKESRLIANAVVIGDRRPFVSALLTLDAEEAATYAKNRGIAADLEALAHNPTVLAEIGAHVDSVNADLSQVEQVKKWTLLPREFTAGAELTPTLKVKRKVVNETYAVQIDGLYESPKE